MVALRNSEILSEKTDQVSKLEAFVGIPFDFPFIDPSSEQNSGPRNRPNRPKGLDGIFPWENSLGFLVRKQVELVLNENSKTILSRSDLELKTVVKSLEIKFEKPSMSSEAVQGSNAPASSDAHSSEKRMSFNIENYGQANSGFERVLKMPVAENDHFQIQENKSWDKQATPSFQNQNERSSSFHNSISQIAQKFESTFKRTDSLMERIDKVMKGGDNLTFDRTLKLGAKSHLSGETIGRLGERENTPNLISEINRDIKREEAGSLGINRQDSGSIYERNFGKRDEKGETWEREGRNLNEMNSDLFGKGVAKPEENFGRIQLENQPPGSFARREEKQVGSYSLLGDENQKRQEENWQRKYNFSLDNREYLPKDPNESPIKAARPAEQEERSQMKPVGFRYEDYLGYGFQTPKGTNHLRDIRDLGPEYPLGRNENQRNEFMDSRQGIGSLGQTQQSIQPDSMLFGNYYRSIQTRFDDNSHFENHRPFENQGRPYGNRQRNYEDQNRNPHFFEHPRNNPTNERLMHPQAIHDHHRLIGADQCDMRMGFSMPNEPSRFADARICQAPPFQRQVTDESDYSATHQIPQRSTNNPRFTEAQAHRENFRNNPVVRPKEPAPMDYRQPQQKAFNKPQSHMMFLKEIPVEEEAEEAKEPLKQTRRRNRPPVASRRPLVANNENDKEQFSGMQIIRFSDFKPNSGSRSIRSLTPESNKNQEPKQREEREDENPSYLSIKEGSVQNNRCPSLPRKSASFNPQMLRNKPNGAGMSQSREKSQERREQFSQKQVTQSIGRLVPIETTQQPRVIGERENAREMIRSSREDEGRSRKPVPKDPRIIQHEQESNYSEQNYANHQVYNERDVYSHDLREKDSQGYRDEIYSEHCVDERVLAERIQKAVSFQPKYASKTRPSSGNRANENTRDLHSSKAGQRKVDNREREEEKAESALSLHGSGKKPASSSLKKPKRHSSTHDFKSELNSKKQEAIINEKKERETSKRANVGDQRRMSSRFEEEQPELRRLEIRETDQKAKGLKPAHFQANSAASRKEVTFLSSESTQSKSKSRQEAPGRKDGGVSRVEDFSESTRRLLREADRALHSPTLPTLRVVHYSEDDEETPKIQPLTRVQRAMETPEPSESKGSQWHKSGSFSSKKLEEKTSEQANQATTRPFIQNGPSLIERSSHFLHEKDLKEDSFHQKVKEASGLCKKEVHKGQSETLNKVSEEYNGDLENGKREGYGTLLKEIGGKMVKVYEGEWHANKYSGRGTLFAKNHQAIGMKHPSINYMTLLNYEEIIEKYEGDFEEGEKNGLGTLFFLNGAMYSGQFKNNSVSGYGTWTELDGTKIVGEWDNGEFIGVL